MIILRFLTSWLQITVKMSNQVWLSQLKIHRAIAVIRAQKMVWGEQMALAVAFNSLCSLT